MDKIHFHEGLTPTPQHFDTLQGNAEDAVIASTHAITGAGVLEGLDVSIVTNAQNSKDVVIAKGKAVGPEGHLLRLKKDIALPYGDGIVVITHATIETKNAFDLRQQKTWDTKTDALRPLLKTKANPVDPAADIILAEIKGGVVSTAPRQIAGGWNALRQQLKSELMTEITNAKQEAQNAIAQAKKDALNAAVPIGFIYTQFPNQPTPQTLWGNAMTWQNVSSDYAGCFFRAEGKGYQAESAQDFDGQKIPQKDAGRHFRIKFSIPTNVDWNGSAALDYNGISTTYYERFDYGINDAKRLRVRCRYNQSAPWLVANEFRPVNYTVRIWRRTA